ncbi:MAG: histidine--tRNA ligase [Candidatus Acidiferrales bacterium]
MKFQAIKGVRDITPPESAMWNHVEQTAREVFATFRFAEIRLPIFEQTQLFVRSIGTDTDVVSKEMFSFDEQGGGALLRARESVRNFLTQARMDQNAVTVFRGFVDDFIKRREEAVAQGVLEVDRDAEDFYRYLLSSVSQLDEVMAAQRWNDTELLGMIKLIQQATAYIRIGESLSLRPEATASVARAYIEHGMQTLPGDVKLYYIGPMFRRERPQKGRYRQFYQIGAEVLGSSDNPRIDAEVIGMLMTFLDRLQLAGAKLAINSIGCQQCRPAYVETLREALRKVKDRLGVDSQRRIETNPLRVLDSKLAEEQSVIETLPRIADHLCAECRDHFAQLREQLNLRGITYEINWRLVRGLDYYMRTTFEITALGLGSQDAICGGGRYDGLVELLGGPPTKGIGFAIGTDRLILSLQEAKKADAHTALDICFVWFGAATYPAAAKLAARLRGAGFRVELPSEEMKFKKALSLADRLGARHAIIVGEDELAAGIFTIKRLADSTQQKLGESELLAYLSSDRGA